MIGDAEPWAGGGRPPWTEPVLAEFVRHARATRRCRRLLEKTPTHIDRAEWLLDGLPDARLLFIHRHPVDTFASYRRRAAVDPKAGWAALSVDEFAGIYVRQGEKAQLLARKAPDRFRAIGYEEFTRSPATVMADVCDFVGEIFVPAIVEEPNPDLSRARHDPHLYGRITPLTKDTADFVDDTTADEVTRRTAETARAWGYAVS